MKVTLKNINKSYDHNEIINHLNLEINSGELISLLGPSGCGKSTTLFMIAGLEEVTGGQIFFGDEEVTNITPDKRGIGLVFQNYALYPHFTVLKNVMYPILNQKVSKAEAKERAMEIIKSVKLEEHINKLPSQLSGGQQQRVAIARAIGKNPKVLLLDEPISNLDAKLKEQTSKEIREIQKKFGITTIFVTHDQQEALAVSDRIVILENGQVQQVGTPKELYQQPANLHVAKFIGTPSLNIHDVEVKAGKIIGFEQLIDQDIDLADGHYIMGIRPENLIINKAGQETEVISEKLLGRDLQLTCKINDHEFEIIIRNGELEENNAPIKFKVSHKNILLFDGKTNERVY